MLLRLASSPSPGVELFVVRSGLELGGSRAGPHPLHQPPGELMTVARFRSRPVEIEAHRWDGTADGATRVIDWILGSGSTATYTCSDPDRCSETDGDTPHSISIRTLEGTMRASFGDWIIKGTEGEFYPCKDSVFQRKYERVTDGRGSV